MRIYERSNVIGNRYGRFVVTGDAENCNNRRRVIVDCDCGTKGKIVRLDVLISGTTLSCGCLSGEVFDKYIDLTGHVYGRLTVVAFSHKWRYHRSVWRCRCECGKETLAMSGDLRSGKKKSCGCLFTEVRARGSCLRHGMSGTAEHTVWIGIRDRCCNRSNEHYKDYGGRGITVCARWREEFEAFFADMGPRPDGLSIDRLDNDKGYWCGKAECSECGPLGRALNCRWATRIEQAQNKRNNRTVTAFGRTQVASEWQRETGVHHTTFCYRIAQGLSPEDALSLSTNQIRAKLKAMRAAKAHVAATSAA